MKTLRKLYRLSLIVFVIIVFTSCVKDNDLAKNADGCWYYSYIETYDDGTKAETTVYINLIYEENTNGGRFLESTQSSTIYENEDELTFEIPYSVTITGKWEINEGDMCQHYDMSTLNVNAYVDEMKISVDNTYEASMAKMILSVYGDDFTKLLYAKVADEFNKDMFKEYFHLFKKNNVDNACYTNVEINGSTLVFDVDDLGRTKCKKLEEETEVPGTEFLY